MTAPKWYSTSRWRLVQLLEQRGSPSVWELRSLLADRGISMTLREFTWMFHPAFDRVSLRVVTALCDILQVDLDALINVAGSDVVPESPLPPGPWAGIAEKDMPSAEQMDRIRVADPELENRIWRSNPSVVKRIESVVDLFVNGRYDELASMCPYFSEQELRSAVDEYGKTLTPLPDGWTILSLTDHVNFDPVELGGDLCLWTQEDQFQLTVSFELLEKPSDQWDVKIINVWRSE